MKLQTYNAEEFNEFLLKIGDSYPGRHAEKFFVLGLVIKDEKKTHVNVGLYINPEIRVEDESTLIFGNFYIDEEFGETDFLKDEFTKIAAKYGAKRILGPMNGSTWDQYRFSSMNFKLAFFTDVSQPKHYLEKMELLGFEVHNEYCSTKGSIADQLEMYQLNEEEKNAYILEHLDQEKFFKVLPELHDLVQNSFQSAKYFSGISKEDFIDKYAAFAPMIKEDLVLISRRNNQLVGFVFSYPDLLDPKGKSLIVKTIGRAKSEDGTGAGKFIYSHLINNAKRLGYETIINAFMQLDGVSNRIIERSPVEVINRYQVFCKPVDQ